MRFALGRGVARPLTARDGPHRGPAEPPLVPILRPFAWSLVSVCAHRPLLGRQRAPDLPYVALGRDVGAGVDYLRWEGLESLGVSFEELEAFGLDAVREVEASWAALYTHPVTGRPVVLGWEPGGLLGATRALDADLLERAAARLGTRILLAAVPTTGAIYVADGSPVADQTTLAAFREFVGRKFQEAEGIDALTDALFVVREGAIIGQYRPPKDG